MKKSLTLGLAAMLFSASAACSAIVFTENFNYPNGPLVGAVGSPWQTTSGTAGQVDVVSNAVAITQLETEDVNAPLDAGGGFWNDGLLTVTLTATFTSLPGTANYFAHLKDNGTSNFRGRIFATTTGAAAGSFRLGISNSTTTVAFVTTDLSLNTPIGISMVWSALAGTATLSVNGGPAVAATDAANPLNIYTIGLRQSTNIGVMTLDNIRVETSLAAVPEVSSSVLLGLFAGLGLLRRRR